MKNFLLNLLSPLKSPILLLVMAFAYYMSVKDDTTGDIGRLGQIVFSKEYRQLEKFHHFDINHLPWISS